MRKTNKQYTVYPLSNEVWHIIILHLFLYPDYLIMFSCKSILQLLNCLSDGKYALIMNVYRKKETRIKVHLNYRNKFTLFYLTLLRVSISSQCLVWAGMYTLYPRSKFLIANSKLRSW